MSSTSVEIVPRPQHVQVGRPVTDDDFMPLLAVKKAIARKDALNEVIQQVLKEGTDYGIQPGSANDQKVLKKSGAEKLISTFGLSPRIVSEEKIEDWTGEHHGGEPFFYYKYVIALYRGDVFMGEAGGSCNSWETKYRWRWVPEAEAKDRPDFAKLVKKGGKRKLFEFDFSIDKAETTGKYGKPAEYWARFKAEIEAKRGVRAERPTKAGPRKGWEIEIDDTFYRIPNPNPADVVNTVQKMGYKRALVAPVLVVTNCSDAFTQDLDEDEDEPRQTSFKESGPEPPPPDQQSSPASAAAGAPAPNPPAPPAQQTLPVERVIPEELEIMIAAIRRDPRQEMKRSYDLLLDLFRKRGGEPAMRAYDGVNAKFRARFPKGSPQTIEDHVNNILDIWDELQKFPEPAEVPPDSATS